MNRYILIKIIFHVMLTFSSLSIFGCKQEIDNKEAVKTEWVQDMKDTKKCNLEVEVMGSIVYGLVLLIQ